jgi:hypothetical protein
MFIKQKVAIHDGSHYDCTFKFLGSHHDSTFKFLA